VAMTGGAFKGCDWRHGISIHGEAGRVARRECGRRKMLDALWM
jgi:hypothetical protein